MVIRPMIGSWEVPRIERIRSVESRRLARLEVPGLLGDMHQDLGSSGLAVEISGSLHGDEARDALLTDLREMFRAGEPVALVADIASGAELEDVMIEALHVEEVNEAAGGFRYRIVVREHVEPPEPPAAFDDLGTELGAELDGLAGLGLDGLALPDMLGAVPDLADPVAPILPALDAVEEATGGVAPLVARLQEKFA